MNDPVILEVCVDSPRSALAAARGGANRIELCSSLVEGGLTPSAGLIATVRSLISIDLYVMIRPRGGDFCYSDDEFAVMKRDVATANELRVDGVVFGILKEDGNVDQPRCRELLDLTRPLRATFHRAFDMSRDLNQSLEDLIELGFDSVLTSGGKQRVEDAIPIVARLREHASNRIALIVGSGINPRNVQNLISQTGVREVHASAREIEPSPMQYRNEDVSMGTLPGWEYQREVASEEQVRNLVRAIAQEGKRSQ
jgi:copper homeostasis protein